MAALHEGATLPPSALQPLHARPSPPLPQCVGAAALAAGMFVHGTTGSRLLEMALGAVLIFVAVAMVAKYVVRPLASVIGWPAARFAGSSGRLARENATRNPARTAATAAALMIGFGVVVFVAVFAQGFKTSFVSAVDRSVNAAIVVSGTGGGTFPDAALATVRGVPGVDQAAGIYLDQHAGQRRRHDGHDGRRPRDVRADVALPLAQGRLRRAAGRARTGNAALVEEQFATKYDLSNGKSFVALGQTGARERLTVIGEYRDPTLLTGFTVGAEHLRPARPATDRDPIYIIAREHRRRAQTKAAVADGAQGVPDGQGADQGRVHRLAQEAGRPAPDC